MKRAVLLIGGSHDGATVLRTPAGPRPVYRVKKATTWVEDLRAGVFGGRADPYVETYELRQFAFTLDGRLEKVYEVYAVEGTPDSLPAKTAAEIIGRLRGIYPAYERIIPVKKS